MAKVNLNLALEIDAWNAVPSTCVPLDEFPGAVDVDVCITLGGFTIEDEITLIPREYDGKLAAFGSIHHWVGDPLIKALGPLGDEALQQALNAIEAAARVAAESVS